MTQKKLGHYEIVEQLGAGGMGEVYRAKDTKLGRDVAIKILPEAFAADEERRARFDREARLLASLNHPNIGTIYGLEEAEGTHFLVLELVEGEDLTEHINRGPMPLDEALAIAKQVAIALEAAHGQDIVHRDLKPGNIRITPDGTVKVLDFGLAKAVEGEASDARISQSPTILTGSPTMQGVILGTAAYMSPEQARGKPVDKRADNWAFGCVLYEMLTGDMTFSGETVTDTLAKILERDPQWDKIPATTPPHVRRVLRRCLTKDPRDRLHDIADARIELEGPTEDEALPAATPVAEQRTRPIGTIIAVTAIAAVVFGFALAQLLDSDAPAPEQKVRKFVTPVPGETTRNGVLAISPDGMTVAYSDAPEDGGQHHLVVHPLEQLKGHANLAVQGQANPAFSPDGDWIVYATASEVWRVPTSGGDPRRIADARAYESFHWWRTDEIVMSYVTEDNVRSIARLPASGGTPEVIVAPRDSLDEWEYGNPFVLPEGRGILFHAYGQQRRSIMVWDAESGEIKEVIHDNAWAPRYAPTGHLVFIAWDGGSLEAVRFDLDALEVSGTPVTVADARLWDSQYGISDDGVLVYLPQDIEFEGNRIMRVASDGEVTGILETGGPWRNPSLSGDGRFLLMREVKASCVVWLYDIERASMSRLTFDGDCHNPTFSPDSRRVIYSLEDAAARHNHVVPIDGSAPPRPVGLPGVDLHPRSWSRDAKWVASSQAGLRTKIDIYLQNMETGEPQEPWLQTRFDEQDPAISPDGRWIAYTSNETGANEVYVRPFDGRSSRYVVSVGGGGLARWSPDGKHLYYTSGEALYLTTVETQGDEFRASRPEKMFQDIALLDRDYAVQPDGGVIVVGHTGVGRRSGELVHVLGFFEELNKLVPEAP